MKGKRISLIFLAAVAMVSVQAQQDSAMVATKLPCDSTAIPAYMKDMPELLVRASRKYVKATSRGLQISMEGNPVAKLGNAMEAIKQMPLIDPSGEGISVLGHGTPVIYINNRLVRSTSELNTLSAENISSVEIITNPSSKYGADVTSVILIRTKKLNEGIHAIAAGKITASEEWSESGNATLNYHTENGLTVLGDFSYNFSGFKQNRHYGEVFSNLNDIDANYHTDTYSKAKNRTQALMADAGINYDFGKNAVGIKYMFRRTPKSHYTGSAQSTTDYRETDEPIASVSELYSQSSMHHVNAFGDFKLPAQIELRLDADYVKSFHTSNSGVDENNLSGVVSNSNVSNGTLWSGKLVLSRKFHQVEIEAGADISYTFNQQDYIGSSTDHQNFIAPETDHVRQNLYAGFVDFEWAPGKKWMVYGGMRWETTDTDFRQNDLLRGDLSKRYTDWLPNLGVSLNTPVHLTFYYRASVSRPGYQSLDNTYVYVTPTLWETGNAELRSTLFHQIGLSIAYKKFTLQETFTVNRRNRAYIYRHDESDCINIVSPVNLPDYNSFQLVAVQQLDFGLWHPTFQGLLYVQDLKYGTLERKYRKPLYTLSLNNRFDLPKGTYAYFGLYALGTGHQDVIYSRGIWQASLTLNKKWKEWTFVLSANDLFNTWQQRFDTFTNTINYSSDIKGASRMLSFTARYTLNKAKGNYKGKVSRQDEIDRL